MTSSLVGSEMCIRDSTNTALALCCHCEQGSTFYASCTYALFFKYPPAVAVSYTHLTLPTICSV
eukprot:1587484-Prorocentrum_lima.AAC.1